MKTKNKVILLLLCTTTLLGFVSINKSENKKINKIPTAPVEIKENDKTKLYMEYSKKINAELQKESEFIFAKETFDLHETWGESANTNVTVASSFEAKYGMKCNQTEFIYNPDKKIFQYIIQETALNLSSITNIDEITEIGRNETTWDKMKDSLPFVDSGNEERKETAINRLLIKSKEKAKKNTNELKILAEPQIVNHINSFMSIIDDNLEFEIIWSKK